ncbi:hypothetical protein BS756_00870 [Staphylococcus sp. MB371]|nr:hypothetical protein BS756_00870 [Staphylococcus sp. MB371]
MAIIVMFLYVLIILFIFRSVVIKFQPIYKNKFTSTKAIVLNKVINFIKKEVKFFTFLYVALVGIYVLTERVLKYNVYPANVKDINNILSIIHDMNANEFIYLMYLNLVYFYVLFILPYRLIKFYNQTIKDSNSKDYIHLFIVNNYHKFKNKRKQRKKQ